MNTGDLSGIPTVKRVKLQNTFGKQIATLFRIKRKLLIGKQVNSQDDKENNALFEES